MPTLQRFEKIEQELQEAKENWSESNRRNCWMLILITLAVVGAYTLGFHRSDQQIIRAKQFVLVDVNGKTRATMVMCNDGPGLIMKDANGKNRFMMTVDDSEPKMFMFDENGKPTWSAP